MQRPYHRSKPSHNSTLPHNMETDTSPEKLGLPLAQKVHQSFSKTDTWITASGQILGRGVNEYLTALPKENSFQVCVFSLKSYQMLGVSFLEDPAIISTSVQLECHPFPNISLLVMDLETLGKLSRKTL